MPQIPSSEMQQKVRSVLADLVAGFIKERPGVSAEERDWPVDRYAKETLEPLFKELAMACLAKAGPAGVPVEPLGLLRDFVREKQSQGAEGAPPMEVLLYMEKWCGMREQEDRNAMDAKDREIADLKSKIQHLEEELKIGGGHRSSMASRRNSAKVARRQMGGTCLAFMLRKLHEKDISSASQAFLYFSAGEDEEVSLSREQLFRGLMDPALGCNFNEEEAWAVVDRLDPEKSGLEPLQPGYISFDEFKAALLKFLAQSQDFHSSFSEEEFNAVMARIGEKLIEERGISLQTAFRDFDTSGEGTLDRNEFIDAIAKLNIGLSTKESAQLFYAMDVDQSQSLTLDEFVGGIQRCMEDNPLKGWAQETFLRLAEDLARKALEEAFRKEATEGDRLDYEGFIAVLSTIDPTLSQSELSRLWCILDKQADEQTGSAYVNIEIFLANMGIGPQEDDEGMMLEGGEYGNGAQQAQLPPAGA